MMRRRSLLVHGLWPSHGLRPLLAWAAPAAACLAAPSARAQSDASSADKPTDLNALLQRWMPSAKAIGAGTLRFWGLSIYTAQLWSEAGFVPANWANHPLALVLVYQRSLKGAAIVDRSLLEMQRQSSSDPAERVRWRRQLAPLIPDIESGDTLVGLSRPSGEFELWWLPASTGQAAAGPNGWQRQGGFQNPALANSFMGIWLSPDSSEPALRRRLLGLDPR